MGLRFRNRTVWLNDDEQRRFRALPLVEPTMPERRAPKAVSVTDIWFEEPLNDDWVVAYRLSLQDQETRVAIGEVRIFPAAAPREPETGEWGALALGSRASVPAGGLKTRTLKSVRLRAFEHELSTILKRLPLFRFRAPAPSSSAVKRGPKVDIRRYAEIAVLYGKSYEAGSTHPTVDIRTQLKLTAATARAAVAKARKLGLLTETERGEGSGRATARAFDILKTIDNRRKTR